MVPAMPASRPATPSAATALCTARKSTARGRRHDTRWMATAAVTVWTAPMRATNRKAGRSPTNAGPKSDSMPGHATGGRPTHGAGRHAVRIVESEPGGAGRAGDDPHHRRPRTQPRRSPERDGADHEHGRGRRQRRAGAPLFHPALRSSDRRRPAARSRRSASSRCPRRSGSRAAETVLASSRK